MKKTTPQKISTRLAQYGALSMAIAGIADANGQIEYYDLDPDVGGENLKYDIRMNEGNGDNTVHFTIEHNVTSSSAYRYLTITNKTGNSFLGLTSNAYNSNFTYIYPSALNSGDLIGSIPTNSWINDTDSNIMSLNSCVSANPNSQWCGIKDNYLGLRFKIGADPIMVGQKYPKLE